MKLESGPKQEKPSKSIKEIFAKITENLQKSLGVVDKMTPEQIKEAITFHSLDSFFREPSLSMPIEVDPKTALKSLLLIAEAVQELKEKGINIDLKFKLLGENEEPPKIKKF